MGAEVGEQIAKVCFLKTPHLLCVSLTMNSLNETFTFFTPPAIAIAKEFSGRKNNIYFNS